MTQLKRQIFGELFHGGELDDALRELVTLTVLTANQTLPQLRVHMAAALNIGVSPLAIVTTVCLCAPVIGIPKALKTISAMNKVFRSRGITLVEDAQGRALQISQQGYQTRDEFKDLPEDLRDALPDLLADHCFGESYASSGLTLAQRELLLLCLLAALGGADTQLRTHALDCLKAGNDKATLIAALIHGFPYMGFPRAINAIRLVKEADNEE